jgi:hypothetical protein
MVTLSRIRLLAGPAAAENGFLPKASQSWKRANWFDQLGLKGLLTYFLWARKASWKRASRVNQCVGKQGKITEFHGSVKRQPRNDAT